jgi:light-regulated signal transduction histidine kinase (bacteriophytochrome)
VISSSVSDVLEEQGNIPSFQPLTGAWVKGVGLHATKLLVELHGGQIWLEHQPDVGNTFYATFTIAP